MKPTAVIVMFVLMALLCVTLVGCQLLAALAEAAGVPVSPAAHRAAERADNEGWSFLQYLLYGSIGLNVIGGAERTHKAVQRRRAAKKPTT